MRHTRRKRLVERVLREGPISTGVVLTTPDAMSQREALAAAEGVKLNGVLRDMGTLAGRALADELEVEQLRPADYSEWHELSVRVRERLVQRLARGCREFDEALAMALRGRG